MDKFQKYFLSDVFAKMVANGNRENKVAAENELLPGDRRSVAFEKDGQPVILGAITRTKPRTVWKVVDEAEFTKWAVANFPDKVERVPVPKEWFVKSLLEQAAQNGVAVTDEGEEIPGIDQVTGSSYASVKPEKNAVDRIRELVQSGELSLTELLQIETDG